MKFLAILSILFFTAPSLFAQTTITSADGVETFITDDSRIITVGGAITETVFALEKWNHVVATDPSSTFPPQVFRMPRVPYVRNLTSEGLLSMNATLIIASDEAKPESAIQQIRDAGTPVLLVQDEKTLDGVIQKLETIGTALGKEEKANELIELNRSNYLKAEELRQNLTSKPRVMFVLETRNGSSFMVAGAGTGADKMLTLAGAENVFSSIDGYRPVSNESILSANPDYVLVFETRFEGINEGLRNTPGVNLISAVQNDQVIGIDGNFILGFGPRFGEAILSLMDTLHPDLLTEVISTNPE
jgi:iron complex transport system substrate-binding protein